MMMNRSQKAVLTEYIPLRLDTLPCSDEDDRAMLTDEDEGGVSRAEEGSDVGL
jgi:hypothetical protein